MRGFFSSTEVFDPVSGSFTATADMTVARQSHTATLLTSGAVLVVGGQDLAVGSGSQLASAGIVPVASAKRLNRAW